MDSPTNLDQTSLFTDRNPGSIFINLWRKDPEFNPPSQSTLFYLNGSFSEHRRFTLRVTLSRTLIDDVWPLYRRIYHEQLLHNTLQIFVPHAHGA